jgi:hypothetical protein
MWLGLSLFFISPLEMAVKNMLIYIYTYIYFHVFIKVVETLRSYTLEPPWPQP